MKNLQDAFLAFLDSQHRPFGGHSHFSQPDRIASADGNSLFCTLIFNAGDHHCCWNPSCHIGLHSGAEWEDFREVLSKRALRPSQLCLHVKVEIHAGASFDSPSCSRSNGGFDAPFSALKLNYEDTLHEAPSFTEFIDDGAIDISSLLRDFYPEVPHLDEEFHQRHTPHRTVPPHFEVSGAIKGNTLWFRCKLLSTGGFCCPAIICHTDFTCTEDWQYLRELLQARRIEPPRRLKVIWEQITERGAIFYDEPYIASPWCSTETSQEWIQMWEELPGQPEPEGIEISQP
ncbi:hypothetical protein [Microbulbifer guangxiensis]|uniref:hypothetical protein n=1 Tax=Microbulbifer guangxiensis TaxID=2904249 RepID=UPI001F1B4BF1|nr:hypothetical protein [Microbulbifer guangxiensis]